MTYTRKTFELVAQAFKQDLTRSEMMDYFIEEFEKDNPDFDKTRFILACSPA